MWATARPARRRSEASLFEAPSHSVTAPLEVQTWHSSVCLVVLLNGYSLFLALPRGSMLLAPVNKPSISFG